MSTEPNHIARLLVDARALIAEPSNWIRGRLRDYDKDGMACCWCAIGAINQLAESDDDEFAARNLLKAELPCGMDIASFNDMAGHGDLMKMFDLAIAKATGPAA